VAHEDAIAIRLDLLGSAGHAPDPHVVDLTNEGIPSPRGARPIVGEAGADLVEAAEEVRVRALRIPNENTVQVKAQGRASAIGYQGDAVPLTVIDGPRRNDLAPSVETTPELAVRRDVERRH